MNMSIVPHAEQIHGKKYHKSTIGRHREMKKTYNRIAKDYYWRNMRSDVYQFVRGCESYQSKKLVCLKTKLPMLVTDTSSKPFEKISLDLYGPINKPLAQGHTHILSIQDWLPKYIVLAPFYWGHGRRNRTSAHRRVYRILWGTRENFDR